MKRRIVVVLCCLFFFVPGLSAETKNSEYALFKKMIAPVYKFGENGIITVPKAVPAGVGNVYYGANGQTAGKVQGEQLYLVTESLMFGTSTDVELGGTKRQFVWGSGEMSTIKSDTFHFKANVLHFPDYIIPQLAIGMNAMSLTQGSDSEENTTLFNTYATTTIEIPFGEFFKMSITGCMENNYVDGKGTTPFYSMGMDMNFADTLYLFGEYNGMKKEDQDPVANAGLKVKLWWFDFGIAGYNLTGNKLSEEEGLEQDEARFVGHFVFQIPFKQLFSE